MGGRSSNGNRNSVVTQTTDTRTDLETANDTMREYREFLEINGLEDNEKSKRRFELFKNRIKPDAKIRKAIPLRKKSHSKYHI